MSSKTLHCSTPSDYKILGVILARGGSKGIPRKNIRPLNGHPLIAYSIAAGKTSRCFTHFVVSTDDSEIASIARSYGAETPFFRPAELAEDAVFSRDALQHAVIESEKHFGITYDFVVELPAVAPLRDHIDIQNAVKKLINTGADSVISVTQVQDKHPVRMKKIVDDQLSDFTTEFPEGESSRRQDLQPCYVRNGAIYSMRRDTIVVDFTRVGKVSRPFVMPSEKSVNIDEWIDLYLCEALIKRGHCQNSPRKVLLNHGLNFANSGRPKLLVTCPTYFMASELKKELTLSYDVIFSDQLSDNKIETLLPETEHWITETCPETKIDRRLLSIASRLRTLSTPSTGTTHIDTNAVFERKIKLITIRDSKTVDEIKASSEFSFALLMSLIRRIPLASETVLSGKWRRDSEVCLRGIELYGKTLGIIGYGRIGANMACFAHAFGMKVLSFDPFKTISTSHVSQTDLSNLLSSSDIVSLHVHLDKNTQGMIGRDQFSKMKPGSYFINTSRGELIEETALLESLKTGHLAGAATDVLCNEQEFEGANNQLVQYARENHNLIITPHIAGLTIDSETKAFREILCQLNSYLSDGSK